MVRLGLCLREASGGISRILGEKFWGSEERFGRLRNLLGQMSKNRVGDAIKLQKRLNMYNAVKRFFDIVLSGIAILVLSPLLFTIMIILKCTGEHDIFYGQDRIGYKNKNFKMLKFAIMLRNFPNMKGGLHTMHGDPRVSLLGRFLSKMSAADVKSYLCFNNNLKNLHDTFLSYR